MKLQFESYEEGVGGNLKCPSCGGEYMRHKKVEIFERVEDAEQGLHVKIENKTATTDTNLSGNPSLRRDGLTVEFSCENCEARPVLSISQHKGITLVDFK